MLIDRTRRASIKGQNCNRKLTWKRRRESEVLKLDTGSGRKERDRGMQSVRGKMLPKRECEKWRIGLRERAEQAREKAQEAVLELGQCWVVAVHARALIALIMRVRLIEICSSSVVVVKFQSWWERDREMQNEKELSSTTRRTLNLLSYLWYFFPSCKFFLCFQHTVNYHWHRT